MTNITFYKPPHPRIGRVWHQTWMIMRLTALLIIISTLTISAKSYSQKVDLSFQDASLENVFGQIKQQTGYSFMWVEQTLKGLPPISVSVHGASLQEAIRACLKGLPLNFDIHGKVVYIKRKVIPSLQATSYIRPLLPPQHEVTGVVIDSATGDPLAGVTIRVKGSALGTSTDAYGHFSLNVPDKAILVVSSLGYTTKEVSVNGRVTFPISLTATTTGLNQLVVVGFGQKKKIKDITGSISSINSKDIATDAPSPAYSLQGKVTGVRIINNSGNPGTAPTIHIRGITTWTTGSQPLIIIDGQIVTPPSDEALTGTLNQWSLINPSNIESISVLKDASATAIYGSRGANGVILITTKSGTRNTAPTISFHSKVRIQHIPTFDVLNSKELFQIDREMYKNNINPDITLNEDLYGRDVDGDAARLDNYFPQLDPQSTYYLGANPPTFNNWQNAILNKNNINYNFDLSLSGGSSTTNYYAAVNYTKNRGSIKGTGFKRYDLALKVNSDINKYIKVGLNYKGVYQQANNHPAGDLVTAASKLPWQPIYDKNDEYGYARPVYPRFESNGAWNPVAKYGAGTGDNNVAMYHFNLYEYILTRQLVHGYIQIKPLKNLFIKGKINIDYTHQKQRKFQSILRNYYEVGQQDPATVGSGHSYGYYGLYLNKYLNYENDFEINYKLSFEKHTFNFLAALQNQWYKQWYQASHTTDVNVKDKDKLSIPSNLEYSDASGGKEDHKFWLGYVGSIDYNYNSKYYVTLSYRRDASSGFPKENRWGNFYSMAAAWRISSEKFFHAPFVNDLKLRVSWGQTGNDEEVVGKYAYLATIVNEASYNLGIGNREAGVGKYNTGIIVPNFPNKSLSWEVVTTKNIGIDGRFFDNKITANIELYRRGTAGILEEVRLPYSVGTRNPVFNLGKVRNQGLELQVGYNGSAGKLKYNINGNISFIQNEVTYLYQHQPINTVQYGRVREGKPIGYIRGYKVGGIFQSQEQIDNYYKKYKDETIESEYVQPGDMFFIDTHGNPTSDKFAYDTRPNNVINSYDQVPLGHTIPGFTYGINMSAFWKGFDISAHFYGEGNVDKYNAARAHFEAMSSPAIDMWPSVRKRWTPDHPNTLMPRAVVGDPAGNNRYSSRFVESAAFFRLNSWELGYNLLDHLLNKMNGVSNAIKSLRVYIGGQNNIYLTDWSGLDPVSDSYPLPRGFFFGIDARF